jgi:hypothetical protein
MEGRKLPRKAVGRQLSISKADENDGHTDGVSDDHAGCRPKDATLRSRQKFIPACNPKLDDLLGDDLRLA